MCSNRFLNKDRSDESKKIKINHLLSQILTLNEPQNDSYLEMAPKNDNSFKV